MRLQCPDPDQTLDRSWYEPALSVQRALEHSTVESDRFFDVDDLHAVAKVRRNNSPDLILYRHVYTRRFLNLDEEGFAYRFLAPRPGARPEYAGQYRPHRNLRDAVDRLDLWDLPWMKPGLERHRHGLAWSERWVLRHLDLGDLCGACDTADVCPS